MSAFACALPSPMSHFERDQDFFTSTQYPSNADYGEMESLPSRSYKDLGSHRTQGVSPNSSASSPSTAHSILIGRSSPPSRQRTPIRHHRASKTRAQNSGRAEALLAYAMGQEAQTVPLSQSAYQPSMYMMLPATSYQAQGGYHPSAGMQPQQQGGQFIQSYDSNPSSYFSLGRPAAICMESLPSIQPRDSIYPPQMDSNVPAPNWSSSTAAPLRLMSLPSNIMTPSAASLMNPTDVIESRPKPRCWDHGCGGREFSTYSNLLRHEREKKGSQKHYCPKCGIQFTRTTARNGHISANRCRSINPSSEASSELEARPSQAEEMPYAEASIEV